MVPDTSFNVCSNRSINDTLIGLKTFLYVLALLLIFFKRADDLSSDFGLQGIPVQSLHGNREQCDREQALDDFKKGDHN